jgi:hypothetical protein
VDKGFDPPQRGADFFGVAGREIQLQKRPIQIELVGQIPFPGIGCNLVDSSGQKGWPA